MSFLDKNKFFERNSVYLLLGTIGVVLVGGIVEIIPLFRMETVIEPVKGMRPYTPLELAGFNVYIREGCYNCHSQQIRPLRDEVERYGHYSLAAESMYDHPFQWGSKRTGPDLARVGGKYSDAWHVQHMTDPRSVVPESIMPTYAFLRKQGADLTDIGDHLSALKAIGVPYTDEMVKNAYNDAIVQSYDGLDTAGLQSRYGAKVQARDFDGNPSMVSDMDALIAYLQMLGTLVDFTTYEASAQPGVTPASATVTLPAPATPAPEAPAAEEAAPAQEHAQ